MKATLGLDMPVEVWQISLDEEPEAWVQERIANRQMRWEENSQGKHLASLSSYVGQSIGFPGDWVVYGESGLRMVSDKDFQRDYRLEK